MTMPLTMEFNWLNLETGIWLNARQESTIKQKESDIFVMSFNKKKSSFKSLSKGHWHEYTIVIQEEKNPFDVSANETW